MRWVVRKVRSVIPSEFTAMVIAILYKKRMVTSGKRAKIFFVGGVNGAGKSSLLKVIGSKNLKFKIIRGSEHLMKWLGLKVGDYEALRTLPIILKNREIGNMMRNIVQKYSKSKSDYHAVFIDAHYLRIHDGRITNAVGNWMSLFDGLFLITANPAEIVKRIDEDVLHSARDRALWESRFTRWQQLKFLKKCVTLSISKVKYIAKKYGIPYWVINNGGSMRKAANEFVKIIKSQLTK